MGDTRNITNAINLEIGKVENRINQILSSTSADIESKRRAMKPYQQGLKDLYQLLIDFVGCRGDLGQWYLGFLRSYPDNKVIQNNIGFFQEACLRTRLRQLD